MGYLTPRAVDRVFDVNAINQFLPNDLQINTVWYEKSSAHGNKQIDVWVIAKELVFFARLTNTNSRKTLKETHEYIAKQMTCFRDEAKDLVPNNTISVVDDMEPMLVINLPVPKWWL
jgi:hypothetical protein